MVSISQIRSHFEGAKKNLSKTSLGILFVCYAPIGSSSMAVNEWIFCCTGITTQENISAVYRNIFGA